MNELLKNPEILKLDLHAKSYDSVEDICTNLRERQKAFPSQPRQRRDDLPADPLRDSMSNHRQPMTAVRSAMASKRLARSESYGGTESAEMNVGKSEDEHSRLTNWTAPARSNMIGNHHDPSRRHPLKKRWSFAADAPNQKETRKDSRGLGAPPGRGDRRSTSRKVEKMVSHGDDARRTTWSKHSRRSRSRSKSASPRRPTRGEGTLPGKTPRAKDDRSEGNRDRRHKIQDRENTNIPEGRDISPSRRMTGNKMPPQRPPDLTVASLIRETNQREGELIFEFSAIRNNPMPPVDNAVQPQGIATIATLVKEANRRVEDGLSFTSSKDDLPRNTSFRSEGHSPLNDTPEEVRNHQAGVSRPELAENSSLQPPRPAGVDEQPAETHRSVARVSSLPRTKTDKHYSKEPQKSSQETLNDPSFQRSEKDDDFRAAPKPPRHPSPSRSKRQSEARQSKQSQRSAAIKQPPNSMASALKGMFARMESKSKHAIETNSLPEETHVRPANQKRSKAPLNSRGVRKRETDNSTCAGSKSKQDQHDEDNTNEVAEDGSVVAGYDVYDYLSHEDKRAMNKIRKYVIEAQNLINKATMFMNIDPMEVEVLTIKAFAYANEAEKAATTLGSSPAWKGGGESAWSSSASATTSINGFTFKMDREEHMRRLQRLSNSGVLDACFCNRPGGNPASPKDIRSLAFETMHILDTVNKNVELPSIISNKINMTIAPTIKQKWLNYGNDNLTSSAFCGKSSTFRSSEMFDDMDGLPEYRPSGVTGESLLPVREEVINKNEHGASSAGSWLDVLSNDDSIVPAPHRTTSATPGKNPSLPADAMMDTFSDNEGSTLGTDGTNTNGDSYYDSRRFRRNGSVISAASTSTFSAMEEMLDVVAVNFMDKLCAGPREDQWHKDNMNDYARRVERHYRQKRKTGR